MWPHKREGQAKQNSLLTSDCDFKVLQHYFIFYTRIQWFEREREIQGIANS